jgi:hypothetical protein
MSTERDYEALFVGRAPVSGPITTSYLDTLVTSIAKPNQSQEELRCRVKCSVEGLVVWNSIRKDEGFESDGESQASTDGDVSKNKAVEVPAKPATDAKKTSGT